MVVDGVDIAALSDEELFSRLQALGATCGPITGSTRKIYQKKLVVLMSGDVVDVQLNNGVIDLDVEEKNTDNEGPVERRKTRSSTGSNTNTSQFTSESSPDVQRRVTETVELVERRKTRSSTGANAYISQYTSENSPDVQRHVTETVEPFERMKTRSSTKADTYTSQYTSEGSPEEHSQVTETVAVAASPESSGVTFEPERHTPTFRKSLRNVTASSPETITAKKGNNNRNSPKHVSSEQTSAEVNDEIVTEAKITSELDRAVPQHVLLDVSASKLKGQLGRRGSLSGRQNPSVSRAQSRQASTSSNIVVGGVDIEALSDEELFSRLQAFGEKCGPIVESTRKNYQKKLLMLMDGNVVDVPQNNGDVEEEEYSDNEEPVEQRKTSTGADVAGSSNSSKNTTITTTYITQYTSSGSPEVHRQVIETEVAESPEASGVTIDPEHHTPSPRRSLRTVTPSPTESITARKAINNRSSPKLVSSEQTPTEEKKEVVNEESRKMAHMSKCRSLAASAHTSSNMVVDGVDIEALSDEELFSRLQAFGATCGPIVESTRKNYQKKLLMLMDGDVVNVPQNNGDADLDEEEEYSDNEEPVEERKTWSSRRADIAGSPTSSKSTSTTKAYTLQYTHAGSPVAHRRDTDTSVAASLESSGVTFDPERHSPLTRKPLRSFNSSPTEHTTTRNVVNNGKRIPSAFSPLQPLLGEKTQSNVQTKSGLPEQSNVLERDAYAKLVSSELQEKVSRIPRASSHHVGHSRDAVAVTQGVKSYDTSELHPPSQRCTQSKLQQAAIQDNVENQVHTSSNMVADGADILTVSDEELFSTLQSLGATCGPMNESTRKIEEKNLLMRNDVVDAPQYNGGVNLDEEVEFSDNEVYEEPFVQKKSWVWICGTEGEGAESGPSKSTTTTTTYTSQYTNGGSPEVRRRVTETAVTASPESSGVTFEQEHHTPPFRKSLRNVTSSSPETITARKVINNEARIPGGFSTSHPLLGEPTQLNVRMQSNLLYEQSNVLKSEANAKIVTAEQTYAEVKEQVTNKESSKMALVCRLLIKLVLLALLFIIFIYIYQLYQNNSSDNSKKSLEELAKQALEAATRQDAETSYGPVPPAAAPPAAAPPAAAPPAVAPPGAAPPGIPHAPNGFLH